MTKSREIQRVMLEIMPGAILNISGVVSGCLCQDGPECSAQVWVLAHYPQTPERSKDLELSESTATGSLGQCRGGTWIQRIWKASTFRAATPMTLLDRY